MTSRRALVTAASSGLGFAVARRLVEAGYATTIVARDPRRLGEARERLVAGMPEADVEGVSLDLEQPGDVEEFAHKHLTSPDSPQVFVYSTGGPALYPPGEETEADLRRHLQSHSLTLMAMVRQLAPRMQDRGWGRVLTIMARTIVVPRPQNVLSAPIRLPAWAMLKTYSLSAKYSNVTFNAVLPGLFDTERFRAVNRHQAAETGRSVADVRQEFVDAVPAGRVGAPDELAALCEFLVSDAAGYINGQSITIDGGAMGVL